MAIRKFLVGVAFVLTMVWLDYSPRPIAAEIALLVAIPATTWFVVAYIWQSWKPVVADEDALARTLAGVVAGVFVTLAVTAATQDRHLECSEYSGAEDDASCVGEYVEVPGPDHGKAFLYGVGAILSFAFGVKRSDSSVVTGEL